MREVLTQSRGLCFGSFGGVNLSGAEFWAAF